MLGHICTYKTFAKERIHDDKPLLHNIPEDKFFNVQVDDSSGHPYPVVKPSVIKVGSPAET